MVNVGKYTSPMDCMGNENKCLVNYHLLTQPLLGGQKCHETNASIAGNSSAIFGLARMKVYNLTTEPLPTTLAFFGTIQ